MHKIKQRRVLLAIMVSLGIAFPLSIALATRHSITDDAPCVQQFLDRASSVPSSDCLIPEPNRAVIAVGTYGNIAGAAVAATLATDDEEKDEGHHHHDTTTCFFSSSVQGTPMMDELIWVREFRDRYLMPNLPGRTLVEVYYWVSPPLARFVAEREPLRAAMQVVLVPTIWACKILLQSPKVTLALVALISVCIGSVLFMLTMVIAKCVRLIESPHFIHF